MTPHAAHGHDRPLIPIEDARRRALSLVDPLPPRSMPLAEAHGYVLAEEVLAPADLPPFPSSAMDGFAVRGEDVRAASPASPVSLRLAGRVEMGHRAELGVGPREAVAVPTGGAIPEGGDTVVPIEGCSVDGDRVLVLEPEPPGRYVRPAGEDLRAGEVLVPRGRRLAAPDVGLLAAAGMSSASVHPPPRVLVLSTGDELVEPGRSLRDGELYDANSYTLEAAVAEAGAIAVRGGIVPDDPARLRDAVAENVDGVDVVLSSGGVSVGERDPVKAAFATDGVEFVEVAMQPGKPQAFGRVADRPFFGLPGNPVSVFVSFEVFVRPALMAMMRRPPDRPHVDAVLVTDLERLPDKTRFARVSAQPTADGWTAASTGGARSNLLATVSRANGLAVVPPGTGTLPAGARCSVMLFRDEADR